MATLRITTPEGRMAIVATSVSEEAGRVWVQDACGHWWQSTDQSFDQVANHLDFELARSVR